MIIATIATVLEFDTLHNYLVSQLEDSCKQLKNRRTIRRRERIFDWCFFCICPGYFIAIFPILIVVIWLGRGKYYGKVMCGYTNWLIQTRKFFHKGELRSVYTSRLLVENRKQFSISISYIWILLICIGITMKYLSHYYKKYQLSHNKRHQNVEWSVWTNLIVSS